MRIIILLLLVMTASLPPIVEANDLVFEAKLTRMSKYLAEIQLCNDNFIGTDWNKSMKYEKRCKVLWNAWTNEIKTSLPY